MCRIWETASANKPSNNATSDVAGSRSRGSIAYPSASLWKDNTFSLNKICSPWHIPCWTINLNLLPFHSAAINCGRWGGGSLLLMSQQMKKLAEKSHLLVVTLMSPGSHRIMRSVACRLRGGREKAVRSYRWLCITSNVGWLKNMSMWCAGAGFLKMWRLSRTVRGKKNQKKHNLEECRKWFSEWVMSYNLDLDDVW